MKLKSIAVLVPALVGNLFEVIAGLLTWLLLQELGTGPVLKSRGAPLDQATTAVSLSLPSSCSRCMYKS